MKSRMGELGVRINDGKIEFDTHLLDQKEFTEQAQVFEYFNVQGKKQTLDLTAGQLCFTICQVPVVYSQGNLDEISVLFSDGKTENISGQSIANQIKINLRSIYHEHKHKYRKNEYEDNVFNIMDRRND